MEIKKPIHAKPSLYAFYFEALKHIAIKYGFNLVLHGSMARDLDLIAIAWKGELGDVDGMISEMAKEIGGKVMRFSNDGNLVTWNWLEHGRKSYVINLNRECRQDENGEWLDANYYIDISVVVGSRIN